MHASVLRIAMLAITLLGATNFARADVVLVGCTGSPTFSGPPSSIVDISIATGAASNPRNTGIIALGGIATQPSTGILFGLTTYASSPVSTLITIDVLTGAPTAIGPTGLPFLVE